MRKSGRKKRLSKKDMADLGRENLEKLSPMAIPLLAVKIKESPNNDFIKSSISVITERPHALSDKWIASINNWADSIVTGTLLDEPEVEEGQRVEFEPIIIGRVCKANPDAAYPMPAIIAVDDRGWKWYFKTSKAHSFKAGDVITFSATVSCHKEGITFMRRPSKIKKVVKIDGDGGQVND